TLLKVADVVELATTGVHRVTGDDRLPGLRSGLGALPPPTGLLRVARRVERQRTGGIDADQSCIDIDRSDLDGPPGGVRGRVRRRGVGVAAAALEEPGQRGEQQQDPDGREDRRL